MARTTEEVLIPKLRVGVLIGKSGAARKHIAEKGKVSLRISADGLVEITGQPKNVWTASQVVEAIGRGFSPEEAFKIFNPDFTFELIYINEFAPKNPKRRAELRGRLIGTQGKIKHIIQKKTKTKLSIYGKTVAIIGPAEGVDLARRTVEMLLRGSQYGTALGFLTRKIEGE